MIIATPVCPNDTTGGISPILTIQVAVMTVAVPPRTLEGNSTIWPRFIVVSVISSEHHSVLKVKTVTCWIIMIWSYILFSLLLWCVQVYKLNLNNAFADKKLWTCLLSKCMQSNIQFDKTTFICIFPTLFWERKCL